MHLAAPDIFVNQRGDIEVDMAPFAQGCMVAYFGLLTAPGTGPQQGPQPGDSALSPILGLNIFRARHASASESVALRDAGELHA